MKKEDFTNLLTDLYQAYNPDYLEYIPQLVEKYSRMEFSAIDMVFVKYNRKSASYYDPQKDTDEYKHSLIKDYSEGKRTLADFIVKNDVSSRQDEVENKFAAESKKFQENISSTIETLKNEFSEKEKEVISAYEDKIKELTDRMENIKPVKQGLYDDIDVKIISNYTESEIKLPNKDKMIGLGVGARIITSTKEGKMIGLKVVDIIYDCVSDFNGKPIIEIIIDKE